MINGISYPKFYIYDSTNTTLVETIELKYRVVSQSTGTAGNGNYVVRTSPFSYKRKQMFRGYRIKDQIKIFSPEIFSSILSYQSSQNNDTTEQDVHKAVRIVDYSNAGYAIRYVPHVDLEDIYGYTYSLVHVTIDDLAYGQRNASDFLTINIDGIDVSTYWAPFRKFDLVNCVEGDGTNDYISLSSFSAGTVHSFEVFCKSDSFASSPALIGRSSSGDYIYLTATALYYSAGASSIGFTFAFSTDTLYHIFLTRNGTSVSLYVNSVFVSTKTLGANNNFQVDRVMFYSGSLYWDGKVSSMRLYQTSCDATQIKNQYAGGYGNYPLDVSAYLIYELDGTGGTSTTETDQSGNGRTGTLQNGVTRTTW